MAGLGGRRVKVGQFFSHLERPKNSFKTGLKVEGSFGNAGSDRTLPSLLSNDLKEKKLKS